MSDHLPNGWSFAELDDLCQIVRGITFPTTGKRFSAGPGLIACLRTANVQVQVEWDDLWFVPTEYVKNEEQYILENDILISTANSYELVGKVARVIAPRFPSTLGAFISLLRAEYGIAPLYLYYQMSAEDTQRAIREMSSTTTNISNVSGAKLKTLKLAIAPLNEQNRIVEKLEELLSDLDAGVAELKAAQKKLVQYRQSLLKAAVEGALTAEWRKVRKPVRPEPVEGRSTFSLPSDHPSIPRQAQDSGRTDNEETGAELLQRILIERRARWETKQLAKFKEQGKAPPKDWQSKYPEPVKPDTSDLPELPDGWVWATLDQLAEFITSGSRGWADYYSNEGATFIRSQNINKDCLDLSDIAFVTPPRNSEGERTRVGLNDLLLTITGANVGKAARVEIQIDEAYVSQHVALIRPVDLSLSKYLHFFLTASAGGRGQLDKEAYGAGKPGLNLQQVKSVLVPLPPKAEGKVLIECLANQFNAITEQSLQIAFTVKQSAAQRKNILKAAFFGQLVPQDPNDEPASVLLERIRAERAVRDSITKPRKRKVQNA